MNKKQDKVMIVIPPYCWGSSGYEPHTHYLINGDDVVLATQQHSINELGDWEANTNGIQLPNINRIDHPKYKYNSQDVEDWSIINLKEVISQ